MTLRTRLVSILAVLITLGFIGSGAATYGALKNFLYDRVDSQLRQTQPIAVHELIEAAQGRGGFPGPPRGSPGSLPISAYAEARDAEGDVISSVTFGLEDQGRAYAPDIPDLLAASELDEPFTASALEEDSYLFRVLVSNTAQGGTLIVAIPLLDAQTTLQRLIRIELVVAVVVLVAIAILAWVIIRKELRPLDEMAGAATEIAAGNLSRRVEEPDPRTEVGRLGRALNRMLEQIELAFEARRASEEGMRRFLGDASHELRTPLTSIRGYAELFRRGASDRPDDLRLSMRRIEDEAARMGVLVDELLMLANADRTRPMEFSEIDLAAVVTDASEDARARDPARPIETEIDQRVSILGDETRIRQAFNNLVANALVHTPPATPVTVSLRRNNSSILMTVEDSGPGLDEETRTHAFDRFWRRDPSRSRDTGGAGLGLAIVEAVARGHGGSVTAENSPSGGARFTLRLPADRSQPMEP